MPKKTPPSKEYPPWSEARVRSFVRSALRKAWSKWPPKHLKIKNNRVQVDGKRHKFEIQCEHCQNWFPQTQIDVDHIVPAGSSDDWNKFIENLFVGEEKLALLCKECHKIKSTNERKKNEG